MTDNERQELIVRQTAFKVAAYTLGAIKKDAFTDTDAALAVLEAMANHVEERIWQRAAPNGTVQESHPDAGPECPIHHKSKEGKYGLYCPSKLQDGTWCQWKPK